MTETSYTELDVWDHANERYVKLIGKAAQDLADEFEETMVEVGLTLEDLANITDMVDEQRKTLRVGSPSHTRASVLIDRLNEAGQPIAQPIIAKHIAMHEDRG